MRPTLLPVITVLLLLTACGGKDIEAGLCQPVGNIEPICGIPKPEDMALLPDGKSLLLSLYGSMFDYRPGALALFDTERQGLKTFDAFEQADAAVWGNGNCPGAPGTAFSPHGIHLSQRADGATQLLVVNHGGREAIEFFEVKASATSYDLQWRGCVSLPDNHFANSVVATPEGGFIYSHMFAKDSPRFGTTALASLKAVLGSPSGAAYEWLPAAGAGQFKKVAGSDSGFPNGLEISADGRYLFLNTSIDGYVYKIDRRSGQRVARSEKLPHLDNMRWDKNGYLLVAHMPTGLFESVRCLEISAETNCGGAFNIVRLDPQSLASEPVFSHAGGQPMGAATVAQQVGDYLYIGSYAGNRMLKVPYAPAP